MIIMLSKYICHCNMESFVFQGFFLLFHDQGVFTTGQVCQPGRICKNAFLCCLFSIGGLENPVKSHVISFQGVIPWYFFVMDLGRYQKYSVT